MPIWRASARMALVAVASAAAAVVIATSLVGCADYSGIAPVATLRDGASLGLSTAAAPAFDSALVKSDWWRDFGDAQLNVWVEAALANNPSLKLAQARLGRANAVTEVANAATQPQLNAQVDVTRQRYTANGAVPPPLAGSVRESATAQFTASWELDFFGKNRAALDAALGSVKAAQADAQAASVLLASSVVRSYFGLQRLLGQTQLAERTLAQRQATTDLVQSRVRAGLETQLELRQSETGPLDAKLQLLVLHEQTELARNALAALAGLPEGLGAGQSANAGLNIGSNAKLGTNKPQAGVFSSGSAIKNEVNAVNQAFSAAALATLPTAIPADLLGRRADIAAARWRVEAAGKDVVNAKTQFYPNLNLVAFAGLSSIGLNRLLESGSQQWGVGPALRLPIFDAGRLRANLRGKSADLDAAVESYNAAVIEAVRDVADQLASLQAIGRQQTEQRAAQTTALVAYDIGQQRYQAGLANYLQVLSLETAVLTQRRLEIDLAARALDTRASLMRALGGGYSLDPTLDVKNTLNTTKTIAVQVYKTPALADIVQ